MKEVGVSILCLAYNHEKYIREALEGFLNQKTSFPIEIIINEDASIDGTADIIREFEQRYPGIIKPIYHAQNVYSRGININAEYMLPKATGKYIALCDGDDYWIDPYKLQKQYDVMEQNCTCQMCLHKVFDRNESLPDQNEKFIPTEKLGTGLITSEQFFDFFSRGNFFNEVCYFFRKDAYVDYQNNYPEFAQYFMKNRSDDVPMILYFANLGDIYYFDEPMAVYRRFVAGSWSQNNINESVEKYAIFCKNSVDSYKKFNEFSNYKYKKYIDYWIRYFEFKAAEVSGDYDLMVDPRYSDILKKQKLSYQKRITLIQKNRFLYEKVFGLYDWIMEKIRK